MEKCGSCGKESKEGAKFCVHCGKSLTEVQVNRCPRCGHENPPYGMYCGECGSELPSRRVSPSETPYDSVREPLPTTKQCPVCGREMSIYDSSCPMCGGADIMSHDYFAGNRSSTSKPAVGGVLLIIGGVLALFNGILLFAVGSTMIDVGGNITCCGGLELLFAIGAIIGGISALQRTEYTWALIGAILCLISVGPLFMSSLLGLIALIMIATSQDDFA